MKSLYIIPDRNDIDKSVEIATRYNACFEYNDFFEPNILDNKQEIDRLVKLYLSVNNKKIELIPAWCFYGYYCFQS